MSRSSVKHCTSFHCNWGMKSEESDRSTGPNCPSIFRQTYTLFLGPCPERAAAAAAAANIEIDKQLHHPPTHQILLSLSRPNGVAVLSLGGEDSSLPSRHHGPGDVLGHGQPGHQAQDVPLLRPGALGRLPARHQGGDGRRSVTGRRKDATFRV